MPIKISIALSTYNGARFLIQQLDSLLCQTCMPLEIVVVDDCSSDQTYSILQTYQQKYSHLFRVYRNEHNIGFVASFQKAMGLCRGTFIALCDQDDIWLPRKLEILLCHIGNKDLVFSDAMLVDDKDIVLENSMFKFIGRHAKTDFLSLLFANTVTGCTLMFRKHLLDTSAFPIPSNFYAHDHYLALVAILRQGIVFCPDALLQYRQHDLNVIGGNKPTYDIFLKESKKKGKSYLLLLENHFFSAQFSAIELVANYRVSLSKGLWQSQKSIFDLLKYQNGYKYLIYFYLITGFGYRPLGKFLYNMIYRLRNILSAS